MDGSLYFHMDGSASYPCLGHICCGHLADSFHVERPKLVVSYLELLAHRLYALLVQDSGCQWCSLIQFL